MKLIEKKLLGKNMNNLDKRRWSNLSSKDKREEIR